jgi:hypothetical protein
MIENKAMTATEARIKSAQNTPAIRIASDHANKEKYANYHEKTRIAIEEAVSRGARSTSIDLDWSEDRIIANTVLWDLGYKLEKGSFWAVWFSW